MSDKSKLGFNINPKNYDELNSTDNLITSGSDSGWLGKKLQGDDSNDLDLSKINPLFDKDLYEKYRPGVNTNDGSVNQDIWGYKCFNSPVSFRNGIYGDTYSIQSVEDDDKTLGIRSGISIQPYQKNTANNISTLDNKHYSYNVYFESEIFGIKEDKYIASTYTGNLLVDTFRRTVNNYQLFYNSYVNGSSIENISSRDSNGYSYDYCKLYTFNNPKNTELSIYNGIDIYSKINKNNEYNDEINIASSKCDTSGSRFPYKVSRITVGTDCSADTTLEQEQSVSGNCIRMYSANGNEHGVDHTNDNISSIIITPDYISISAKNNANQSADNPYIKIDGTDNSITLHTGKLNLPDTIETTTEFANKAGALSKEINSANYIYATDNSILPSNDSVISLGSYSYKYSDIYADRLIGTALAAQGITYRNILDGTYTDLLITTSANKIVPYDNRKIDIGSTLAPLQNIYADKFIGTVTKAERDGNNNIITDTYFKLDSNNTITGLNYIKGAGEHIRFTEADTGSARTFTSIATSYADNYHEYCTNLRWSNNDETAFIVCGLNLQISYDPNSDSGEFQILPHVYTDSTSPDITMSMVLGSIDEPLSSIYCNEFPTLYKTIACNQFNTINTPYYGTSIGNIRLLCIVLPPGGPTIYEIICPGYKFTGMFILGKNTYHARLARFNAYSPNNLNNSLNNLVAVLPVNENDVDGTWVALSGADVGPSLRDDEIYVPILAMRVE